MKKRLLNKRLVLLAMRITCTQLLLAVLFCSLSFAHPTRAQEVLNREVTVRAESVTVKQLLKQIEEQADIRFVYSSSAIQTDQKVSFAVNRVRLSNVLDELLGKLRISYEVVGNRILLRRQNQSFIPAADIRMEIEQLVTGTVTDEKGEPLPGVNVALKGTTTGAVTDKDGKYKLNVPDAQVNGTLVFSYVGYITKEAPIGAGRTVVDMQLQTDTQALSEVVVVGYGSQKRSDLTGSIATVKPSDLRSQGSNTVQKALQGRVPGVSIESAGGNPGSGVRILVRGAGSLNNNDPLYIVDGVQVANINNILPSDIASIDILKDASAAAIYGSRAANGVVLITTKTGKKGENKIDFNAYFGVQQLAHKVDVLNASEWATVSNRAHQAAGLPTLDIAKNPETLGAGTDWQKAIYQTAPMQNYELSASGGGDNYNYSVSGGYMDQDGIVKLTNYNRLNLRVKSDFTKGRIRIGETILLSRERWRTSAGGWGGQGGGPVGSALKMIPVFQIYDKTAVGGFGGAYGPVTNIANPVAQLYLEDPKNSSTNAVINLFAELTLAQGLKYRYNVGYTNTNTYNYDYTNPYKVGALFLNENADLSESRGEGTLFLQEHTLTWDKSINKHNFQLLGGFTFQKGATRTLSASKSGMPDGITVIDAGTTNTAAGSNLYENALVSYLGRAVYSYDSRYLLTATFRRDGSSRFGSTNRFGNFPSVALGWNVANENFFAPLKKTINNLKLRASYGVLGNQELTDYQYSPVISLNANYVIGQDQHLWAGSIQRAFANSSIKWETSKTSDIGADVALFDNKLNVTMDYFVRKNSDILLQVPIPISTGSSSSPYINAGQVTNRGFELGLTYNNQVGELTYQVQGTFTSIKNQVDQLGTGSQQIFGGQPTHHGASATVTQAGGPIGAFYLIKTDGIFQSQAEVDAYTKDGVKIQPNAAPGDIRFVDANGDGVISDADRVYAGSPTPKFQFGLGGNLSWKGIDLSIFFQGTYGNKIYNGLRMDLEGMSEEYNYAKSTLNAWTPENHSGIPRAVINDPNYNSQTSDRFLEDGSYVRLKTLQLGYTLPRTLLDKAKISNCRLYLSFDNLFTLTGYKGFNPDLGRTSSILDRGVDFGHVAYPLARTSMLGVQLSF